MLRVSAQKGDFWCRLDTVPYLRSNPQTRDVHENGEYWNDIGPMGFPWEWE